MTPLLRRSGIIAGLLLGLIVVGYAVVYVLSERILRRTYDIPAVALTVPSDPDSIREGQRLATIRGCFGDCHGKTVEGRVMFDDPKIARVVAPNLTSAVRRYTDVQIAVIVREGVRPDGRSVLVMPSEAFARMTDADVGRIIAFLKSVPPVPGPVPDISIGPLGRLGLVTGKFNTAAELIATAVPAPPAANAEAEPGRYLAQTVCSACHGTDLRGTSNPDFTSPDLRVVASYPPEAFTQLLRTGIALDDRKLGVMGAQARNNLSHLTDSEIAALYRYLHAMPEAVRN